MIVQVYGHLFHRRWLLQTQDTGILNIGAVTKARGEDTKISEVE